MIGDRRDGTIEKYFQTKETTDENQTKKNFWEKFRKEREDSDDSDIYMYCECLETTSKQHKRADWIVCEMQGIAVLWLVCFLRYLTKEEKNGQKQWRGILRHHSHISENMAEAYSFFTFL